MGRLIKFLLKSFLYLFITSIVFGLIAALFIDSDKEDKQSKIESIENSNKQSDTNDNFKSLNTINDLDGSWKHNDDVLYIDIKKLTIKFNDGLEMKLKYGNVVDDFYIYGEVGKSSILKAKAFISTDKEEIYLERLDGGVSNSYKRYKPTSLVDRIFDSMSEKEKIDAFIEITKLDDKAIYLSNKSYPNANDWEKQIDYQRELEDEYRLQWYKKQKWFDDIDNNLEKAYSIRSNIAMYGVKKNWHRLYDKEIREVDYN